MRLRSVRYLIVEGVKNIWANRLMSIASVGVLIACMVIMGVAVMVPLNAQKATSTLAAHNVIMVYFNSDQTEAQSRAATDKIATMNHVEKADFIPKQQGLETLKKTMPNYEALFNYIQGDNPLPDGAQVTLKAADVASYSQVAATLSKMPNVKYVYSANDVIHKVSVIQSTVTTAGFWLIALLLIIALVIIANTIRITMHNRRLEISIMKAVGATDSFIRTPFIIEGIILGIISGILTIGALYFAYQLIKDSIMNSFGSSSFTAVAFSSFWLELFGMFVLIGVLAGIVGSMFSLGKYLKREGSELGDLR